MLVAICGLAIASCGGGGGFFGGITSAVGQALRPVGNLIDENPIPFGDAIVTLVDFADDSVGRLGRTQEVGRTDANGNYSVEIPAQRVAAIIVTGDNDQGQAVRVSGLVTPDQENVSKVLNSQTDIACEAGLSALNDGTIAPGDFSQDRINRLETAAGEFIAANPDLNVLDPAAVSAAASMVRTMTNVGANSAPAGAFGPAAETAPIDETTPVEEPEMMTEEPVDELNCASGTFTCNDGAVVCAEFVCNSGNDCADGSDEDPSICGEQSGCCVATAGCPSETGTSCGETCCCCGINEICDRDNPENGCVSTNGRGVLDPNNPLSKLINGTYY